MPPRVPDYPVRCAPVASGGRHGTAGSAVCSQHKLRPRHCHTSKVRPEDGVSAKDVPEGWAWRDGRIAGVCPYDASRACAATLHSGSRTTQRVHSAGRPRVNRGRRPPGFTRAHGWRRRWAGSLHRDGARVRASGRSRSSSRNPPRRSRRVRDSSTWCRSQASCRDTSRFQEAWLRSVRTLPRARSCARS